jgi:hypothetical protein
MSGVYGRYTTGHSSAREAAPSLDVALVKLMLGGFCGHRAMKIREYSLVLLPVMQQSSRMYGDPSVYVTAGYLPRSGLYAT